MHALGIDPGERSIGIAVSDPTGMLARPLEVLTHSNRTLDAAQIAEIAQREEVDAIIVGQATDAEGKPNFTGRKSARLAAAIRTQTGIPVYLWDESYSTYDARQTRRELGARQRSRQGHQDAMAAAIILQSWLDAQPSAKENE